jgi:hypothetical protein
MPALACLAVFGLCSSRLRSNSLLQAWADENGYTILRREYRVLFKGPYTWTSRRGQTVCRVAVQDKAGHVLGGWVRCGGRWLGLLSPEVDVRWDEATSPWEDDGTARAGGPAIPHQEGRDDPLSFEGR